MSYTIRPLTENGLDLLELTDASGGYSARILPSYGALLHGFILQTAEGPLDIIDHYESLEDLLKTLNRSYKSSKLSPFVCRIAGGRYRFSGIQYEFLDKFPDGSAIHGLLYHKPFSILSAEAGPSGARAEMEYVYQRDDDQYPHTYSCRVTYTLQADGVLEIQTKITNLGTSPLPMADGWHPYFRLGGKVDDWLLHLHARQVLEFDDRLIPTGQFREVEYFRVPERVGHLQLDHCFVIDPEEGAPAAELFNPTNRVKLSFFPDPSYPYLQVYTPPHRRSIAIENLSAAPDCFNNQMGLRILDPAREMTFGVQYRLALA